MRCDTEWMMASQPFTLNCRGARIESASKQTNLVRLSSAGPLPPPGSGCKDLDRAMRETLESIVGAPMSYWSLKATLCSCRGASIALSNAIDDALHQHLTVVFHMHVTS